MGNNLLREVKEILPKEFIKQTALNFITFALVAIGAIVFGGKSIIQLFPMNHADIDVYARLKGKVAPGETIELYPPSLRKVVSATGDVKWTVPFEEISASTLELHRFKVSSGKLSREVLVQQKLDKKPAIIFVLEGK